MKQGIQYTIRNVPPAVDAILKAQAKKRGVSLNTLLLSKIGAAQDHTSKKPKQYHDLDWFVGSMTVQEAGELDRIIRDAREEDKRLARREDNKLRDLTDESIDQ